MLSPEHRFRTIPKILERNPALGGVQVSPVGNAVAFVTAWGLGMVSKLSESFNREVEVGAGHRTAESAPRALPSHGQALAELSEARHAIASMMAKHEAEDEAMQRWFESAPRVTLQDWYFRSSEMLNHDRNQSYVAAQVYRRAAEVTQRVGDTRLAIEFENLAIAAQADFDAAEEGLADLRLAATGPAESRSSNACLAG